MRRHVASRRALLGTLYPFRHSAVWIMNNADQKPLIDNSRHETRDRVTDVKRFPMKPFKFATLFKGNVASSTGKKEWG